jgi:hypothetical protein
MLRLMKKVSFLLAALPLATGALAVARGGAMATGQAMASIDFGMPRPALPSTVRLAVETGEGARRLALYLARNVDDGTCIGWRLGAGPPKRFECFSAASCRR